MASTNLLFALLAWTGKDYGLLAAAVFLDNLTAGLATSAFVAFLSGLCNREFTATQYALLASIGNFARNPARRPSPAGRWTAWTGTGRSSSS